MKTPYVSRKLQMLLGITLPLVCPPLLYGFLWASHLALWPLLTLNILLGLKIILGAIAFLSLTGIGIVAWHATRTWRMRRPRQIIRDAAFMGICLTLAIFTIGLLPPAGEFFAQEETLQSTPLLLLWTTPKSDIAEVTLWGCDPVGVFCGQLMDIKIPLEPGAPPSILREDPTHPEHYQVISNGVVIYTAYP